ncbi:dioxygenase [Streptosporangium sp. NBC_01755]|uniref:dioxygenase family protein n=1 Tax=unclassified Streptosporangium TaxID=2632669 RepID=UPI0030938831|nr:dioxygenase [Streptosporangium sp. NBC_01810]WSC99497.1 dioxygenase [Streptosporangium sp. NBC_01755]
MDAENTHHQNTGDESGGISRKTLLKAALIAPIPLLVGRAPALARDAQRTDGLLDPTPFCDDGDDPTTAQTEGPYFRPNSPRRTSLVGPGTPGVPLTVRGYVFGRSCRPIANALLDFWQADTNGAYDNSGFGFRGHRFSDAQGAFKLTTIVPGLYPGRTRHIHVKVQAPNRPVLTTQRGRDVEGRNELQGRRPGHLRWRDLPLPPGAHGLRRMGAAERTGPVAARLTHRPADVTGDRPPPLVDVVSP